MKKITTEKVIKETVTKYEAYDGIVFDKEDECKEYEKTALGVIGLEAKKYEINKVSEYEFSVDGIGSEDFDIAIYNIKDATALEAINRYIYITNKNLSYGYNLLDEKYIGKKVAISLGYNYGTGYDNVGYIYGTLDEYINKTRKHLEDIFNPTDEPFDKVVKELCS